jgi:hypothetical protein
VIADRGDIDNVIIKCLTFASLSGVAQVVFTIKDFDVSALRLCESDQH